MSWHFSQALEAEFSAAPCSDGEPSAPWRSMPSAPDDSCSAKMKATCHRSPFGMMFVPSTDAHGQELLTSFLAASRARTSAQPGRAQESTGNARDCGRSSLASLARYDPRTYSWKTRQCSLGAGLDEFSETWPRWGLMRDGECWGLVVSEHLTDEKESGLWLPTIQSRDWKGCSNRSRKGYEKDLPMAIGCKAGSHLSPNWIEWFIGWPIGWTGCEPLETAKFRQWYDLHGRR